MLVIGESTPIGLALHGSNSFEVLRYKSMVHRSCPAHFLQNLFFKRKLIKLQTVSLFVNHKINVIRINLKYKLSVLKSV